MKFSPQSESLMSTILIASVAASTSSNGAGPDQTENLAGEEEEDLAEREDLAKLEDGKQGVTLLVPPWHAAARHASLCAVDLSVGVNTLMDF